MKLNQIFSEAEIDFLLSALLRKTQAGVGPIESGVPMAGYYKPNSVEFFTARSRLSEMRVGDSFTVDNKLRLRPFVRAAERNGFRIAFKRLPRGEYRIWKLESKSKGKKLETKNQETRRNNTIAE